MDQSTWIACPGCTGEIGVPSDFPADVVCCPKCAAVVQIDERLRVLWRPKMDGGGSADQPFAPSRWIACHGCYGEIGVPYDWTGPTIACPKCGAIVGMRETSRVLWRPPTPDDSPTLNSSTTASIGNGTTTDLEPTVARSVGRVVGGAMRFWKKPAALVLLVLGGLAFLSSVAVQGRGDVGVGLMAGLLNPLFFVGVPLGLYWLRTGRKPVKPYLSPRRDCNQPERRLIPLEAYFQNEGSLLAETVAKALDRFEAEYGRKPKSQDEFRTKVIERSGIALPDLLPRGKYKYDAERGELMVQQQ